MAVTATPLMTVDEVAAALRCSRHSVYRAVARGELRALRVGEKGPLRVRSRDVEEFLRPAHDPEQAS